MNSFIDTTYLDAIGFAQRFHQFAAEISIIHQLIDGRHYFCRRNWRLAALDFADKFD